MAKIKIIGNEVILTSSLKLDTIKKLEKLEPEALILSKEVDGEVTQYFKIQSGDTSDISKYGIVFAGANKDGLAIASMHLPEKLDVEKAEYVKSNFGSTIFNLKDIEDSADTLATSITTKYAELDELIEEE